LQEIILFSENKQLLSWCNCEIDNNFSVREYSREQFNEQLISNLKPLCILVDIITEEISGIYNSYKYYADKNFIPIILIIDRNKRLSYKMRSLSLDSLFISVDSQSGHLLRILNSLQQQSEKSFVNRNIHKNQIQKLTFESRKVNDEKDFAQLEMSFENFDIFSSCSQVMKRVKEQIERAANSEDPVLLLGESGAGKTFAAKYIHQHSQRKNNIFIPLNVAQITPTLAESQLFGVIKGAYTGAVESKGFFSVANNGTLFLDEIGELSLPLQIKLLDVLESYTYRKVGSTKEYKTDARFIFATNADLKEKIKIGTFRRDLFYRINVLTIKLPALREHKEDIPYLAKQFVTQKNKSISQEAIQKLCDYNWPGNIRELHNLLSRVCIFSSAKEIKADDLDFNVDLF